MCCFIHDLYNNLNEVWFCHSSQIELWTLLMLFSLKRKKIGLSLCDISRIACLSCRLLYILVLSYCVCCIEFVIHFEMKFCRVNASPQNDNNKMRKKQNSIFVVLEVANEQNRQHLFYLCETVYWNRGISKNKSTKIHSKITACYAMVFFLLHFFFFCFEFLCSVVRLWKLFCELQKRGDKIVR